MAGSNPPDTRDPNLEELQTFVASLGRARERFMAAVRHPAGPPDERVELAAAEMLRRAVTVARELRADLSELMIGYAALWARVQRSAIDPLDLIDDFDDDDLHDGDLDDDDLGDVDFEGGVFAGGDFDDVDFDDDSCGNTDLRIEALDRLTEKLELLIDAAGTTSEGRSGDGQVKVAVDDRMRLVELDFDAELMSDPAYKASVVEAVNAGIGPVVQRRHGVSDVLMTTSGPLEDDSEMAESDAKNAVMGVFHGLIGAEEVQLNLARLLPRISRGKDPRRFSESADLIEDICLDSEESLRDHYPDLGHYRALLVRKARRPGTGADDLAGLENLEALFLEIDLDEDFEIEAFLGPGVDPRIRSLIATVAEALQRRDAERRERLDWQRMARRLRARLAEVERQTFEARSRDGLVTARARGTVQLVDLELDTERRADSASIKASVIESVNAAIDEAERRRSRMLMIAPG